jgi:hypothetical protein
MTCPLSVSADRKYSEMSYKRAMTRYFLLGFLASYMPVSTRIAGDVGGGSTNTKRSCYTALSGKNYLWSNGMWRNRKVRFQAGCCLMSGRN